MKKTEKPQPQLKLSRQTVKNLRVRTKITAGPGDNGGGSGDCTHGCSKK